MTENTSRIPTFEINGELPQGRYLATPSEFEARFVAVFPGSLTRKRNFEGWRKRRESINEIAKIEYEWIDGSFVTNKMDPNDIDVVTFISAGEINALTQCERETLFELTNGSRPRIEFYCDSYLVVVVPPEHEYHDCFLNRRGYWDNWWSANRAGGQKGYIMITGEQ